MGRAWGHDKSDVLSCRRKIEAMAACRGCVCREDLGGGKGTGHSEQIQSRTFPSQHNLLTALQWPDSQGPPLSITRVRLPHATLPPWQPSPTKACGDELAHATSPTKRGMFDAQLKVEEQAWLLGSGQRTEQRWAENESLLHNAWMMFVADTHLSVYKSHLKCWKHKRSYAQRLFVCVSSPRFDNSVNKLLK